jgi:hypothetical protein
LRPGGLFPIATDYRRLKGATREGEVFAKIAALLVGDGLGIPIAALVRRRRVVTDAVAANAEVGPALTALFGPAGLAWRCPLPAATMTMTSHRYEK